MQSAVPIGGKLTRYMVRKSVSGSKQAATNEEGDQLLYQSFLVSTNHSVRATAITLWANAGLKNHEILATFGHCNESNL